MAAPASSEQCLTARGFVDAMQRIDTFRGQPIQPGRSVVCDGAMAVSMPSLYGQEAYVVLVRSHGGWNSTGWVGGEFDQTECATLPPKINAYLKDACT
jgi:hypothetical protein